jgi:hypothetical protein
MKRIHRRKPAAPRSRSRRKEMQARRTRAIVASIDARRSPNRLVKYHFGPGGVARTGFCWRPSFCRPTGASQAAQRFAVTVRVISDAHPNALNRSPNGFAQSTPRNQAANGHSRKLARLGNATTGNVVMVVPRHYPFQVLGLGAEVALLILILIVDAANMTKLKVNRSILKAFRAALSSAGLAIKRARRHNTATGFVSC